MLNLDGDVFIIIISSSPFQNKSILWKAPGFGTEKENESQNPFSSSMSTELFNCLRMSVCAQSCPIFVNPWTVACQAPLTMGFSKQEYCSGLLFPSPGDLPDPGIELLPLLHWQAGSLPLALPGKPMNVYSFPFGQQPWMKPGQRMSTPFHSSTLDGARTDSVQRNLSWPLWGSKSWVLHGKSTH